MSKQSVSFKEIEEMLSHFPSSTAPCHGCNREKTMLENTLDHIKTWQVTEEKTVQLKRPRACFFTSSYSAEEKATDNAKQRLKTFSDTASPVHQLCQLADAELRIYELDLDTPAGDITKGAAMTEGEAAHAITYGMMAIEPGIDLIVLGNIPSPAGGLSNQAIQAALHKNQGESEQVEAALSVNNIQSIQKPLDLLRVLGGYELCAMLGTAIASRMAGIPILYDQISGQNIKEILDAMVPGAGDHLYAIEKNDLFSQKDNNSLAIIPSLKSYLILNQNKGCGHQEGCQKRQAS